MLAARAHRNGDLTAIVNHIGAETTSIQCCAERNNAENDGRDDGQDNSKKVWRKSHVAY